MHNNDSNKQEKIWHGPKKETPIFHPDCSVGRVLYNLLKIHGKSVAQISATENISVTYEELLMDTIRIAQNFKMKRLLQDDIIGIVARNTTYATHLLLACWFNATSFHTINPAHEEAVVEHLLGITRPKLIFCEGQEYKKVLQACKNLQLNVPIYTINAHIAGVSQLDELMQSTNTELFYRPESLLHGGHQTMAILNSSGTTGLPKAVCFSNSVLLHYDFTNMSTTDVVLSFAPLDAGSTIYMLLMTLMSGAKRIITTQLYEPEHMLDMIEKYRITYLLLCPIYVAELLSISGVEKRDLSSVRCLGYVGGRMYWKLLQQLRTLLKDTEQQKILNFYTLTEIGVISALGFESANEISEGLSISPGKKVQIIDDEGQRLGVGQTGEILVHTDEHWNGYYNNTAETMSMRDANGWYHTGDLGYINENGKLFICDRKKDVMKYRGFHVFPGELEDVISKLPDVIEVCVFGNTNAIEGDRAAAAIVRRMGSKLTEEQVVEYVASKFEVEWKRLLGGVYFVDSLPRTGTGKAKRRLIKQMLTVNEKL